MMLQRERQPHVSTNLQLLRISMRDIISHLPPTKFHIPNSKASGVGHSQKQDTGLNISHAPCAISLSFLHSYTADVKYASNICSALIIFTTVF